MQADIVGESALTVMPKILERARLGFVAALRTAFSSEITDKDLRYDQDQNKTKIKVYRHHPQRMEFFPSVIISTAHGDVSVTYMGDDFVEEDVRNAIVTFAGRVTFTMSLNVYAKTPLELERIVDHLIMYLRHFFRPNIHAFGIEYTRDMTVGPERLIEVDNAPVHEQVIDIPCYMEYEAPVSQATLDTLRRINIANIVIDLGD